MSHHVQPGEPLPLWAQHVPGATGTTADDIPQLTLTCQSAHPSAVIVCPGGGYTRRAEHEGAPVARWLTSLGIAAFVLDYRVAPYRHPVPLQDAQRAVRIVRHLADSLQIDPQRVGVLGFSAGGHLATSLGTHYDAGGPACRRSGRAPELPTRYHDPLLPSHYFWPAPPCRVDAQLTWG